AGSQLGQDDAARRAERIGIDRDVDADGAVVENDHRRVAGHYAIGDEFHAAVAGDVDAIACGAGHRAVDGDVNKALAAAGEDVDPVAAQQAGVYDLGAYRSDDRDAAGRVAGRDRREDIVAGDRPLVD